jgi:branched-chain amino acid transport system permease protein
MNALQILLQGCLLGGLYALFAIGLSLSFGIMRLVNIAHGDLITLSAFGALLATEHLGLSPFASIAVVIPAAMLIGYLLQRVLLNQTLGPSILPPLLVTFGISVIIQNGLLLVFGADTRRLDAGAIETASVTLPGGITLGVMPILTFVIALLCLGGLQLLLYHTRLGRSFRATSDDAETAQLMGVDNRRLYSLAMAIALAFTALAAVLFAIRTSFDPASGPIRLIFAFEAVIIGGLGSLWGTLLGGIVLGLAQSIGAVVSLEWQILAGHIAFLAILVIKPDGLFPRILD